MAQPATVRAEELIKGLSSWADATVGLSTSKWGGQRVPFPVPSERPQAEGRVDSVFLPLSVHVGPSVSASRAQRVLEGLERVYPVLAAAGWITQHGDGGQAGTGGHDVYVVNDAAHGASASLYASEPFWPYDGARAFARVDARVPESHVEVCAAQALMEALLYELDPAEAPSVRKASAAYVAYLATGILGCDDDAERALERPYDDPFGDPESAGGALWLAWLSARQDQQRGTFLRDLWQFLRQRTWEGRDLRGSPDFFECLAQMFDLGREKLEKVAGELAEQRYLEPFPLGLAPERPALVTWERLPRHESPPGLVIEQLGTSYLWVALGEPRPGQRLKVWSRGELGTRWSLNAARLDAERNVVGRVSAPPRKNPDSYVVVELDGRTTDVLVSLTNVADGTPDADVTNDVFDRGAQIIVNKDAQGAAVTIETSVGRP